MEIRDVLEELDEAEFQLDEAILLLRGEDAQIMDITCVRNFVEAARDIISWALKHEQASHHCRVDEKPLVLRCEDYTAETLLARAGYSPGENRQLIEMLEEGGFRYYSNSERVYVASIRVGDWKIFRTVGQETLELLKEACNDFPQENEEEVVSPSAWMSSDPAVSNATEQARPKDPIQ